MSRQQSRWIGDQGARGFILDAMGFALDATETDREEIAAWLDGLIADRATLRGMNVAKRATPREP